MGDIVVHLVFCFVLDVYCSPHSKVTNVTYIYAQPTNETAQLTLNLMHAMQELQE